MQISLLKAWKNMSAEKSERYHIVKELPSDISEVIKVRTSDSLFSCGFCEYSTPKRAMLGRHVRVHGIFVCLRCNFLCDAQSKLKEHDLEVS